MPTYVYRCQSCDIVREAVQKINADPLKTCEECGSALRRGVFKGSGFYVTDYKRAESAGNGKSAENGNGKSAENSNGKSAESGSNKSADSTPSKSDGGETKPAAEKAEKKETAKPVAAAS